MNITERVEQRGHTLVLCCKYEAHLWLRLYCVAMRGEECRVARRAPSGARCVLARAWRETDIRDRGGTTSCDTSPTSSATTWCVPAPSGNVGLCVKYTLSGQINSFRSNKLFPSLFDTQTRVYLTHKPEYIVCLDTKHIFRFDTRWPKICPSYMLLSASPLRPPSPPCQK